MRVLRPYLLMILILSLIACGNVAINPPQKDYRELLKPTGESFLALPANEGIKIFEIVNCGQSPNSDADHIVLIDPDNKINGDIWNHINIADPAWHGITKSTQQYDISRRPNIKDASCDDIATYRHILVKKYGDWQQQHANGFFATTTQSITFAELDTIYLDIYYDAALSTLPSLANIAAAYPTLTNKQIEQWDDGTFQLNIQLDDSTDKFHAAINLRLANDYANKWLRIAVPVKSLEIWRSSGYDKFVADKHQLSNKSFSKVGFVAETKNRRVYRNYDQDGFDVATTSKLFKEIAFRIKRLTISKIKDNPDTNDH